MCHHFSLLAFSSSLQLTLLLLILLIPTVDHLWYPVQASKLNLVDRLTSDLLDDTLLSSDQSNDSNGLQSVYDMEYVRQVAIGEECDGKEMLCADQNAICESKSQPSALASGGNALHPHHSYHLHHHRGFLHHPNSHHHPRHQPTSSRVCVCKEGYIYLVEITSCIQAVPVTRPCTLSMECLAYDKHSYCDFGQVAKNRRPVCACNDNYFYHHFQRKCVKCRPSQPGCRIFEQKISAEWDRYRLRLFSKILLNSLAMAIILCICFCFLTRLLHKLVKLSWKMRRKRAGNALAHEAGDDEEDDAPPSYEEVIAASGTMAPAAAGLSQTPVLPVVVAQPAVQQRSQLPAPTLQQLPPITYDMIVTMNPSNASKAFV